jgi:hypothetical protein
VLQYALASRKPSNQSRSLSVDSWPACPDSALEETGVSGADRAARSAADQTADRGGI